MHYGGERATWVFRHAVPNCGIIKGSREREGQSERDVHWARGKNGDRYVRAACVPRGCCSLCLSVHEGGCRGNGSTTTENEPPGTTPGGAAGPVFRFPGYPDIPHSKLLNLTFNK